MNDLRNLLKIVVSLLVISLIIGACNNNSKTSKNADSKKDEHKKDVTVNPSGAITIRYVDEDSVLKKYNLAKDFQEMAVRLEDEYDEAARRFETQITNFEKSMQQKYQNNQYNESSYNNDMQRMQQLQQNAQNELAKLHESSANQLQESQKQMEDSINNCLKDYAKNNNIDMILKKGAGFYMNPSYEITDKVIDELNKRYTKVAAKQ